MAAHEYDEWASLPLGLRIRKRREAAKASQRNLAIVAGISRGTLVALEKGSGSAETRTQKAVLTALGLEARRTLPDSPRSRLRELLDVSIAGRLIEIISEIHDRDYELGRQVADLYLRFVNGFNRRTPKEIRNSSVLPLARVIAPQLRLENPIDRSIIDLFVEHGWSRETEASENQTALIEKESNFKENVNRVETEEGEFSQAEGTSIRITGPNDRLLELLRRLPASAMPDPAEADPRLRERDKEFVRVVARAEQLSCALEATRSREKSLLDTNDKLEALVRNVVGEQAKNAQAFLQLPEQVREVLKDNWMVDFAVTDSPATPAVKHVLITLKSPQEHVPVSSLADASMQMTVSLHLAAAISSHLTDPKWTENPTHLLKSIQSTLFEIGQRGLASRLTDVISTLPSAEKP